MNYCSFCGNSLTLCPSNEGKLTPYCSSCQKFFFPPFSCAVITAVLSPDLEQVLLLQQYKDPHYILLSGYIDKGESAEQALLREVKEEVGLSVIKYRYFGSYYFSPSNTLMFSYLSVANSWDITPAPEEVDFAEWFSLSEARQKIYPDSLAQTVLLPMLDSFEKHGKS